MRSFRKLLEGQWAKGNALCIGLDSDLQKIPASVNRQWNEHGNCGLVVGAIYPEELAEIRKIAGNIPLLIPGIGSQGGDLEKAVSFGRDGRGRGIIINASRSIIFASPGEDFAESARHEAEILRGMIYLAQTNAS